MKLPPNLNLRFISLTLPRLDRGILFCWPKKDRPVKPGEGDWVRCHGITEGTSAP
jgi:hypothetical protein